MTNKAGYAEAYRDVIHEDAIKIGAVQLQVRRHAQVLPEAKKLSVLHQRRYLTYAFQLCRYAKVPLSIFADVESSPFTTPAFQAGKDGQSLVCPHPV